MFFLLNEKQKEAVSYISGPCLVIAGAGSGKTRVITEKIVHLINDCGYPATNVCAVTFTNKAAKEMKERISQMLAPTQMKGLRVSTFHSLGLEIVRSEYRNLGLRTGFTLFDEYDQHSVMKEILQRLWGDLPSERIKDKTLEWCFRISQFKNDLRQPDDILNAEFEDAPLAGMIYKEYEACLRSYNAIDFDDLIFLPVKLFRNSEVALNRWRTKIQYMLVDEYQDTNESQYELVKLLVAVHENFTVVGDDDQSIYSWRGARPQNIPLLRVDFPRLKVIMLEQNYRSKGRILHCANKLIGNNQHEFVKKLYSELDYGDKIRVIEVPKAENEGRKLVADLMAHRYVHGANYHDYAILYRGNFQSQEIEKSLQESNIPYRIVGGQSFFAQAEVKDFMCYLRIIASSEDNKAFLRIINIPRREIGPASILHLTEFADKYQLSLLDACTDMRMLHELKPKESALFYEFGQLVLHIKGLLADDTSDEMLRRIPELVGYERWLKDDSSSEKVAEIKMSHVKTLLEWVGRTLREDSELDFSMAVQKMSLRELLDRNEQDFELDEVQLMTLHSSKGLEFPYVYIIGMEEGLLPHRNSIDAGDIDEERRLAYVGITRAKSELTFLLCRERRSRETGKQAVEPSRFLNELPAEDLDWKDITKPSTEDEKKAAAASAMAMLDKLFQKS